MQTQIFNPFIFWSSTNLRFVDDIDTLAEERELKAVVESHDKTYIRYRDKFRKDQSLTNDKQRQWHPAEDQC